MPVVKRYILLSQTMNKAIGQIKLLRTIGYIIFLPAPISMILWAIGKLDTKYMAIINWMVFITEFILLVLMVNIAKKEAKDIFRHNRYDKPPNKGDNEVIIPKGSVSEKDISADTEIFNGYIAPTNPLRHSIFRIKLQLNKFEDTLYLSIIRRYQDRILEQIINQNVSLDTGCTHIFETMIHSKERLNFKFNKDVNVKLFSVEELYIP